MKTFTMLNNSYNKMKMFQTWAKKTQDSDKPEQFIITTNFYQTSMT